MLHVARPAQPEPFQLRPPPAPSSRWPGGPLTRLAPRIAFRYAGENGSDRAVFQGGGEGVAGAVIEQFGSAARSGDI